MSDNKKRINDAMHLKFGHSKALKFSSDNGLPKLVNPKASILKKIPCIPALVPDLTEDIVDEISNRSKLHKDILEIDKTFFRRKLAPNSCVKFQLEKQFTNTLLHDLHPIRDEKDISPSRMAYTYSIQPKNESSDLISHIDDFLQPYDVTRPRSSGYSPGHIRTMLGYDTFGFKHSENLNNARMTGNLPIPHNTDRYSLSPTTTNNHMDDLLSNTSLSLYSDERSRSPIQFFNTSLNDTYRKTNSHIQSRNSKLNIHGRSTSPTNSLSSRISTAHSINSSLRSTVVDIDDKIMTDPRGKRYLWHETYKQHLQSIKEAKEEEAAMNKSRKEELKASKIFRESISEFEEKLRSINRY